jgi:hypothetical protein
MIHKTTKTNIEIVRIWTVVAISIISVCLHAQNVGIGTATPTGKLHIVGSANIPQLIINANNTQSNTNPLISLRDNNNNDLLWIHSDKNSDCFVGRFAGKMNGAGFGNSFFGSNAGSNNTFGYENTALGYGAFYNNTSGFSNTAAGTFALTNNLEGNSNCAFGEYSLYYNNGSSNIALGNFSLYYNTIGSGNIGIGYSALYTNRAGSNSVAIGVEAMQNANNEDQAPFTTYNVALGYRALKGSDISTNNTGTHNTALGSSSLFNNSTGDFNSATGSTSLIDNTTGDYNVANGYQALFKNTTGYGNTGLGAQSNYYNTTGLNNTAIGKSAWFLTNNLSNTTCIGYFSGGQVEASNRIEIGNPSVSWVGGQMNWGTYSDGRIKDNVRADVPGLDFINRLRPVTYNLNIHHQNEMRSKVENEEWEGKYDIEQMRMTGFIAQEVEQAAHDTNYDFSGVQKPPKESELYSLRYAEFVVPLVKSVQELSQENLELKNEIQSQHDELIELKAEILAIKEKLNN